MGAAIMIGILFVLPIVAGNAVLFTIYLRGKYADRRVK